jgi:hypothetical protein
MTVRFVKPPRDTRQAHLARAERDLLRQLRSTSLHARWARQRLDDLRAATR